MAVKIESDDLLPVRMLSQFAYCPRLFYLMHVEGRWLDNQYTIEGRHAHRRTDKRDQVLPEPTASASKAGDGDDPPETSRSVKLGSERFGLIGKLDLVSTRGDEAVPVETKRGRVPKNDRRSHEPERVQLMAQALLLRDNGYTCHRGFLYYAGSRTRVEVPFTAELEARTLELLEQARQTSGEATLPPPLDDSPKCDGCSLAPICLPDETLALREVPRDPAAPEVRRLYPVRDEAQPFYVQKQGARIGKRGSTLIVRLKDEDLAKVRLKDVSQLVLCGGVTVSYAVVHLLCEAGVPIVHLSRGNWFYGITHGIHLRNAFDRAAQFQTASDPARCLEFARAVVMAKVANQRTMLRRNISPAPSAALDELAAIPRRLGQAAEVPVVLGLEGQGAAVYFRHFGDMLKPRDFDASWDFTTRNRRPPRDPVNALLSFAYALLASECSVALQCEGLDPWWGLFHRPRHGRPALALDLMEEFRPLIADSSVLTAVNTGMVAVSDFLTAASGCVLQDSGRKAFIRAFAARLDQLVTHPVFGYRCSWRAIIRLQARLLCRWLRRDVERYEGMVTR